MWLDAAALLLLGIFIGMGALRGAFSAGLGILALVTAYAAALWTAPALGSAVADALSLPPLLGVPLVGSAVFLLAYAAVALLGRLWRRLRRPFGGGAVRSARDRFLGGAFGAVRGGFVVLLLAWLAIWVDALRVSGAVPALPPLGESAAAALAADAVEAGLGAALSESGSTGRLMARAAARPGDTFVQLEGVIDHRRVAQLRDDRLFWTYLEHGAIDTAMNRLSFVQVARDDALRGQLAALGMIEAEAAADPGAFREAFAPVLSEVGESIRGLREDPDLRALVEDGEVVALVQRGDTLGLLIHPGFRRVVAKVAAGAASE